MNKIVVREQILPSVLDKIFLDALCEHIVNISRRDALENDNIYSVVNTISAAARTDLAKVVMEGSFGISQNQEYSMEELLLVEDLRFKEFQTETKLIKGVHALDAYGSCYFSYEEDGYYYFNSYDQMQEEDIDVGQGTHIADCLLYSIKERTIYVFSIGYKDGGAKIYNLQWSELSEIIQQALIDSALFGKRSYYWDSKNCNIDLRCNESFLIKIGEESPSEYSDNCSGTRLRIKTSGIIVQNVNEVYFDKPFPSS